jgi:hypothetical protein
MCLVARHLLCNVLQALPVGDALRVMGSAAGISAASLVSTVAAPAGFGALRAWATGAL